MVSDSSDDNRIRMLIATDNHVGFRYDDKVRGHDALTTFEEILRIAVVEEVDMVILGGDLFHENDPPRQVQFAVANLLKKYCMGSKPIKIKTMATGSEKDRKPFNYMDPNINISLPVFSIHGNHDDPVGKGNLAALDLLEVADTINYFGKQKSMDDLLISPILLQKGCTRIALYGLGNIKDDRLYRTFEARRVTWDTEKEGGENTFNMFVLHQNRVRHGAKNYLPENVIPPWFDLAIWGHEHQCYKETELGGQDQSTYIYQPGSSVITSLCEAETHPKHVGLLTVMRRPHEERPEFHVRPIPLTTVRPLVMGELDLVPFAEDAKLGLDMKDLTGVEKLITNEVKKLIKRNKQEVTEEARLKGTEVHPVKTMPLVRLRVKYRDYTPLNIPRFGQKFVDEVANPHNLLSFTRVKKKETEKNSAQDEGEDAEDPELAEAARAKKEVIDLFVESMENNISNARKDKEERRAIGPAIMGQAIRDYVDKQSKDSINETVNYCREQYAAFRRGADRTSGDEEAFANMAHSSSILSDEEPTAAKTSSTRGRGRGGAGRGRGGRGRGAGGAGRGRPKSQATLDSFSASSRKRARSISSSPEAPPTKSKSRRKTTVKSYAAEDLDSDEGDDSAADSDFRAADYEEAPSHSRASSSKVRNVISIADDSDEDEVSMGASRRPPPPSKAARRPPAPSSSAFASGVKKRGKGRTLF